MRIRFKNEFFKNRIMSIIFKFVLIPFIIISLILAFFIIRYNKMKIVNRYDALLNNRIKELDSLYQSMFDKIVYIKTNTRIKRMLTSDYGYNFADELSDFYEIRDLFEVFNMMNSDIVVNIYAMDENVRETSYIKHAVALGNILFETSKLKDNEYLWKTKENNSISIYCGIYYNNIMYGIMEQSISLSAIGNMFDFASDGETSVFYEIDNKIIPLLTSDMKRYEVLTESIDSTSHRIIMNISTKTYYGGTVIYLTVMVLILICLAAIMMYFAGISVDHATKGLYELIESVDVYEFLKEDKRSVPKRDMDEFRILYNKFYELLYSLKEAQNKIQEHETKERKMRMELLQANINPHFLYNSLSAIRWLSKDPKINEFVKSLAAFYRIGLNNGESITTVKRELEMINAYINVERIAFGMNFIYSEKIAPEVFDCLIIKNSIQPIVENAFMHGINGMDGKSQISISALIEDEFIVIEVTDNGRGMRPERVQAVLKCEIKSKTSGYGMKNLIERLKSCYGDKYRFNIYSEVNKGTVVLLKLPYFKEKGVFAIEAYNS